jgi:DNA-binding NarL/FixJ family response regulator
MYALFTEDGALTRISPRAYRMLSKSEIEELEGAVAAVGHDMSTAEFEVAGYGLRLVPMLTRADDGVTIGFLACLRRIRSEVDQGLETLTPTQLVVAEYAASGSTIVEIAEAMDRSPHTIKTHMKSIYRRLEVSSRLELAEFFRWQQ